MPWVACLLFAVLEKETRPGERCVCAIWHGFNTGHTPATAKFRALSQEYWLFDVEFREMHKWLTNPLGVMNLDGSSPNFLWPESRRWLLSAPYNR